MRFKNHKQTSQMPEVNLVPMMDVVLTILTFFIIVSMTLNNQKTVSVTLPSVKAGATDQKQPDPLVVGLNIQNEILLNNKPTNENELALQIKSYLEQNPQGAVLLKADQKVAYEEVAKLLGKMQSVGGERVSLAIESK